MGAGVWGRYIRPRSSKPRRVPWVILPCFVSVVVGGFEHRYCSRGWDNSYTLCGRVLAVNINGYHFVDELRNSAATKSKQFRFALVQWFNVNSAFSPDQSVLNFRLTATRSQHRRPKSRLRRSTLPRPVYESSYWTSKDVYETSHDRLYPRTLLVDVTWRSTPDVAPLMRHPAVTF